MSAHLDAERAPYLDLTRFVPAPTLDELDAYLLAHNIGCETPPNGVAPTAFFADDQKHATAYELCDKDASHWEPAPRDEEEAFAMCRRRRGCERTWRPNANGEALPGVADFLARLPVFSSTGKVAILVNEPGTRGVEHVDHRLPDLVSEMIWIRPAWSRKEFYIKDLCLRKHVVPRDVRVLFFDDHLPHGIHAVDGDGQVSLRVDGVFRPLFRAFVSRFGYFSDVDGGGSLAAVLRAQAPEGDEAADGGES